MKTLVKLRDFLIDSAGKGIAQFVISDSSVYDDIRLMSEDKKYVLEIKEVRSARSLQQNALLWELISKIDKKINGYRSNDELDIYIMLLERAGAKAEYICALHEAEDELKRNFRAIKHIKDVEVNGKVLGMYKVYVGSSKMNTSEMNMLIEQALDVAEHLGISTEYYESELKK